jgi:hypothetical protein
MIRRARPWDLEAIEGDAFRSMDCLISEVEGAVPKGTEHSILMEGSIRGSKSALLLHPYPRNENAINPERIGFPIRPRFVRDAQTVSEEHAQNTLRRMNEVLSRIHELGQALDDPLNVWSALREAWRGAQDETYPRMAEIVKQSHEIKPHLKELETRKRKVLRRTREMVPLDRVQEMDRASMRWLVRQPGKSISERAGASQRILATSRRENFDTPENRVLHAYCRLASDVAREWLREHPKAKGRRRYSRVDSYRGQCRSIARMLNKLDINVAQADIVPNYVLMQDIAYRSVFDAWKLLLSRQSTFDDLWGWQAESWTDFVILAIVLAFDGLDESELITQSPIIWQSEATFGRWFEQERPAAIFWLKKSGYVVEVQSRPEETDELLFSTKAHIFLKVTNPNNRDFTRHVAVWAPHSMERLDLRRSVNDANNLLNRIQSSSSIDLLQDGLILTPAHDNSEVCTSLTGNSRVDGISFDASGESLSFGMNELSNFVNRITTPGL